MSNKNKQKKFTEKISLQINRNIFQTLSIIVGIVHLEKNKIKDFNKYNILLVTGIARLSIYKIFKIKYYIQTFEILRSSHLFKNDIKLIIDTYCSILDENKLILTTEKDFVKLKSFIVF